MKRVNAKIVIYAEIVTLLVLATLFSFAGGTEWIKAILTVGAFIIVIPTAFLAIYGRKKMKIGKTIAGLILFLMSYYLVEKESMSILVWALMVAISFVLVTEPWGTRDE